MVHLVSACGRGLPKALAWPISGYELLVLTISYVIGHKHAWPVGSADGRGGVEGEKSRGGVQVQASTLNTIRLYC